MPSMTRARNAAKGFASPPPLHRLMEAVLLLCVSLVQGVRSTLRMIIAYVHRDWHTTDASEALPQETSGNLKTGTALFPPSVRSTGGGGSPRLRGETEGAATSARSSSPSFRSLSFRAKAHRAEDPELRSYTSQRHTQLLDSGSRASRVSGMTVLVCSVMCKSA